MENEKYYMTGGDAGFMPLVETFVKSVKKFTDKKIIVYGFNCDVTFDDDQIIKRRVNFNWKNKNGRDTSVYYGKIYASLDAITSGYENCMWIDGDVLCDQSIDSIWKYSNSVNNNPLFMIYRYGLIHFRNNESVHHGQELGDILNININVDFTIATGLYLFNKSCIKFFIDVLSYIPELISMDNEKFIDDMALSEERLINVLCWKNGYKDHLPITWISNDIDPATILVKYQEILKMGYGIMYNYSECGIDNFPTDASDVLFYHGQKDVDINNKMFDMLSTINKLLIIAHPDDESIFYGSRLLNFTGWKVVCLTNKSDEVRSSEFIKAMEFCNISEYEILDFEDGLNIPFKENIDMELNRLIHERDYKMIVTHNVDGEYGHIQHVSLHERVKSLITQDNLYTFALAPNEMSNVQFEHKQRLLDIYKYPETDLPGFHEYLRREDVIKE